MKLHDVINAFQGVSKILGSKDIPFSLSWKCKAIYKALEAHVENFDEERKRIIDKYKTTNDKGEEIIPEDKVAEVNAEIEKLNQIEIENLTLPKLKMSDMESVKGDGNLAFLLEAVFEE